MVFLLLHSGGSGSEAQGSRFIAAPPAAREATLQPRGCATTTFAGANFDLLTIVAQAARAVVGALTDDAGSADVSVMSLRSPEGAPLSAPTWNTQALTAHPSCALCESRVADAA